MIARELANSWVELHRSFGIGAPIQDEAQYEDLLAVTDELMEQLAADEDSPVAGLVELLADRIREYEDRVHPWPDTATSADVLRFLMDQNGLKQSDLDIIGSQGVVSEVLKGKRDLNVRQITELSKRFKVSPASFFPATEYGRVAFSA